MVNGRTPRSQSFAQCAASPSRRSIREISTSLFYCDRNCYTQPFDEDRPALHTMRGLICGAAANKRPKPHVDGMR